MHQVGDDKVMIRLISTQILTGPHQQPVRQLAIPGYTWFPPYFSSSAAGEVTPPALQDVGRTQ